VVPANSLRGPHIRVLGIFFFFVWADGQKISPKKLFIKYLTAEKTERKKERERKHMGKVKYEETS